MHDFDGVIPGLHERELVVALLIGFRGDGDAHVDIGQGDRNVGDRRLLGIGDCARDRGGLRGQRQ